MSSFFDDWPALASWPLAIARFQTDWFDTLANTNEVLSQRIPILAQSLVYPASTDLGELSRMVTEKVDALGRSGLAGNTAATRIRRAAEANARALGHLSGGGWLSPLEWFTMFERNVDIAATLISLPTTILAPVRARVASNARRLKRR